MYTQYVPLRDVCNVKSRGWRNFDEKGHEGNIAVSQLIHVRGNMIKETAGLFTLEEKWPKKQQDRSSCWLLLFILNIVSSSYSNPAEYYFFLGTLLYLYSCGSQTKAQPSIGHIFHARAWEETILRRSSRLYLIVLNMFTCLGSWCRGHNFPSPRNVWRHWRRLRF